MLTIKINQIEDHLNDSQSIKYDILFHKRQVRKYMLEIQQVIEDYVSGWNSSKPEDRLLLMKKVLAENCLYLDSHLAEPVDNLETHCQLIESFKEKFPDISLQLSSPPDSHHSHFKLPWKMVKKNGEVLIKGQFFGEVNQQNQITKLVGFIDKN
ncbi:MAG: transposase [Crocosphaera sp.]|nr:transposase [Crocosphaera sp.]